VLSNRNTEEAYTVKVVLTLSILIDRPGKENTDSNKLIYNIPPAEGTSHGDYEGCGGPQKDMPMFQNLCQ
jgi:hypothetical protein